MYQGFFYKVMARNERCPIKNLVSESKERLIETLNDMAKTHVNEHYIIRKDWFEGMPHSNEMDIYYIQCEVSYKNNPKLYAEFIIEVTQVDVV